MKREWGALFRTEVIVWSVSGIPCFRVDVGLSTGRMVESEKGYGEINGDQEEDEVEEGVLAVVEDEETQPVFRSMEDTAVVLPTAHRTNRSEKRRTRSGSPYLLSRTLHHGANQARASEVSALCQSALKALPLF